MAAAIFCPRLSVAGVVFPLRFRHTRRMDIHLLAIGKCRDKAVLSLCDTYTQRLKPIWPVTVHELPQAPTAEQESAALLARIPADACVIVLDERGKSFSTRDFAQWLQKKQDSGTRKIAILIGGADGHIEDVRKRADLVLSLSGFTFPHMMVRPLILEQMYRAATVISGHPYHRD